jgi:hypothetical protein
MLQSQKMTSVAGSFAKKPCFFVFGVVSYIYYEYKNAMTKKVA